MDTLKKFLKYILLLVVFIIFSELLINVGLNSSYKKIQRKDNIPQVEIKQAEATLVNGRIKGTIKNSDEDYLTNKFVQVELFSKRDVLVGRKYIPITTTEATRTQDFQFYFELKDVTSYNVSIVDKKVGEEIKLITTELSKPEIFVITLFTLMMIV